MSNLNGLNNNSLTQNNRPLAGINGNVFMRLKTVRVGFFRPFITHFSFNKGALINDVGENGPISRPLFPT